MSLAESPPRGSTSSDATLILRVTLAAVLLAPAIVTLTGDSGRWKAAQGWLPPGRFSLSPTLPVLLLARHGDPLTVDGIGAASPARSADAAAPFPRPPRSRHERPRRTRSPEAR